MKTIVLIVDDNKDILFSVKESLESDPAYSVECAKSGIECLEKMKSLNPDVILMDIMMPEMDGWDVVAKIKTNKDQAKIPVIYLTGKTDDLSKGMGSLTSEDYIEKPFDPADLRARIFLVMAKKEVNK
jgi:two-component system alkaline phosphatase synthesis response regulator PhoP